MPAANEIVKQNLLETLRNLRRKLFAIPEKDLDIMSTDMQRRYADCLHHVGLAIILIENAELRTVNDEMKAIDDVWKRAATQLQEDAAALSDSIKVITVISDTLNLISNMMKMIT